MHFEPSKLKQKTILCYLDFFIIILLKNNYLILKK